MLAAAEASASFNVSLSFLDGLILSRREEGSLGAATMGISPQIGRWGFRNTDGASPCRRRCYSIAWVHHLLGW